MISNVWQINWKCNCKLPRCLVSKGGWRHVFWHKVVLSINKTDFINNLLISKKYLFTYLLELFLSRKCKWLCTIADENNCLWFNLLSLEGAAPAVLLVRCHHWSLEAPLMPYRAVVDLSKDCLWLSIISGSGFGEILFDISPRSWKMKKVRKMPFKNVFFNPPPGPWHCGAGCRRACQGRSNRLQRVRGCRDARRAPFSSGSTWSGC